MVDAESAARGGKARARKLTAEQRREIAIKAAEARWGDPLPRATHAGVLQIGGAEIPCWVLEDGERILSTRSVMHALGRRWRGRKYAGTQLPVFLEAKNLKPFIGGDLTLVPSVINFRTVNANRSEGFKAEVLPIVCETYLKARDAGVLAAPQKRIAMQCEILMRGLAHVGIIALVDEATGYQDARARDALAKILEAFVAKELRKWVKTFPAEFYKELFRLRKIPYNGNLKRPQYIGHDTNNLVYARLAPGVLDELRRKNPANEKGARKSKHFQWLTEDFGHPRLQQHLAAVTALMKASDAWSEFKQLLDRALPKQKRLPLFDGPEP